MLHPIPAHQLPRARAALSSTRSKNNRPQRVTRQQRTQGGEQSKVSLQKSFCSKVTINIRDINNGDTKRRKDVNKQEGLTVKQCLIRKHQHETINNAVSITLLCFPFLQPTPQVERYTQLASMKANDKRVHLKCSWYLVLRSVWDWGQSLEGALTAQPSLFQN